MFNEGIDAHKLYGVLMDIIITKQGVIYEITQLNWGIIKA